jgi:large subunit ribosomal protein L16
MLLKPKKTKYNKNQRSILASTECAFQSLKFGRFGLISQESGLLTARQIEACRQVINRTLKRKGKIWIRAFPDQPITSKPTEVRMGKGKGAVKAWVCVVKKGKILFEVDNVPAQKAFQAFYAAKKKLPVRCLIFQESWKYA